MSDDGATGEDGSDDGAGGAADATADVPPGALTEEIVELELTVERLRAATDALSETVSYADSIERELDTLQDLVDRFEAARLRAEDASSAEPSEETLDALGFDGATGSTSGTDADDTGESGEGDGDTGPVEPTDLAAAERARENARLEAVAALEMAREHLDQRIEDLRLTD
jgi:hypothetical protein